jgi:HPt (histidine-containing phosphotransfer) domain-containing protein
MSSTPDKKSWVTDPTIQELVPSFLANRKREVEMTRTALASRDFAALRRMGHNLKGTGPIYGFPCLGKLGAQIETAARESDAQLLHQLFDELERRLSELV